MNVSVPFIKRPIATVLLMVALVGGLVAYPLLPVSALPDINYPTVTVPAQLPGADPQTMASTVASPLELQFGEIPGLTQMTSASAVGYTQITLQFDLNRNMMGLCLSEIKLAHTDDEVRREMAYQLAIQRWVLLERGAACSPRQSRATFALNRACNLTIRRSHRPG
jgi:AcrB/AcrD/AcrF family